MIGNRKSVKQWTIQFGMHVSTGIAAVVLHYSVMSVLLTAGMSSIFASSIGFIAGAVWRFSTAYFKIFAPTLLIRTAVPRFLFALATQFILNGLLLLMFNKLGMEIWAAQISSTILLTPTNFLIYRLWVFT